MFSQKSRSRYHLPLCFDSIILTDAFPPKNFSLPSFSFPAIFSDKFSGKQTICEYGKGAIFMILLENALDYENYIRLRQSVNWNCFSKEQTLLALQHSLYDVTAVNETETIAMGRLVGDGMYFMIVDVVVHPAFQNRKIGTAIMRKVIYGEKRNA